MCGLTALPGCSSSPPSTTEPAAAATSSPRKALAPGNYTVAVTLTGGSGKSTIQSPAQLTVATDSTITATITWSSPYYDWMQVNGTKYTPTSGQGQNSAFQIPVTLDTDMTVTADTTAMSQPYAIDYTLRFDSSTAKAA